MVTLYLRVRGGVTQVAVGPQQLIDVATLARVRLGVHCAPCR